MTAKLSIPNQNAFIPHPMQLFLLGTSDTHGKVNIGMLCWLNFCWDDGLSVTLCMDGQKLTKEHIEQRGIFSACLVTEDILSTADRIACTKGDAKEQLISGLPVGRGAKLDVPILESSPLCYELKVKQMVRLNGSDLYICSIENILIDPDLYNKEDGYDLSQVQPALVSQMQYYGMSPKGKVGGCQ